MIDPAKVALYKPDGLSKFKAELFERIGAGVGKTIRGDIAAVDALPNDWLPLVGCQPESTALIAKWRATGRPWAYWDRGFFRRVFATWLPRAESREASYYRVHLGAFQMQSIRPANGDRWKALRIDNIVRPWRKGGRHVLIAAPTRTYAKFHSCESWIADTIDALSRVTGRPLVIRDKESQRSLQSDLEGAHCLVTHGSIAAVESVVCGVPVFIHPDSAAALVGRTDLNLIEKPVYPDRQPWLNALADSQWNEAELVDGTLWKMLK